MTRGLSYLRLITLSKCACVYLEGEGIINIRPTYLEILSWLLSLVSDQVSAFRQPCGFCSHGDSMPDTCKLGR